MSDPVGFQYTAHCPRCGGTRSLTRAEVLTGHNPECEHDATAMTVYSGTGRMPSSESKPSDAVT